MVIGSCITTMPTDMRVRYISIFRMTWPKRFVLISLLIYLATVSAFLLTGGNSPDLPLLSVIQAGHFRRTDSIFLLLFALSQMLYLSTVLYFAVQIFCDSFNISQKKLQIMPFALILISFSGISFFNSGGQKLLSALSKGLWTITFLVPLIFSLFKEKKS